MTIKIFVQLSIVVLLFLNIFFYLSKRTIYCQSKEAKCVPQTEMLKGRLLFAFLSLLSLAAIVVVELYFPKP